MTSGSVSWLVSSSRSMDLPVSRRVCSRPQPSLPMSCEMETVVPRRRAATNRSVMLSAEKRGQEHEFSYDDWSEALADFFFDEAHDGEEVLFAVDGASLAEATGLNEDTAIRSLAEAVRYVVGRGWGVGCVTSKVRQWRRSGPRTPVTY